MLSYILHKHIFASDITSYNKLFPEASDPIDLHSCITRCQVIAE